MNIIQSYRTTRCFDFFEIGLSAFSLLHAHTRAHTHVPLDEEAGQRGTSRPLPSSFLKRRRETSSSNNASPINVIRFI
ncbi:uncharacterized protein V1478_011162 [Vespula squamosa]|uniref:Uncharacterized protein n=1 Tax=Vespula squamosa TaxID=30214 RepID=A0ABD2ADP5_VESSQ